jgi:hypothetical protein
MFYLVTWYKGELAVTPEETNLCVRFNWRRFYLGQLYGLVPFDDISSCRVGRAYNCT